ncbi:MAG: GC-type dockerin domain-anchored protein [Planctomycetota bacterium]
MKSERAVVGCILGVMVCLIGALFFGIGAPKLGLLDQPVGPSTPLPVATRASLPEPQPTDQDDSWSHAQVPSASSVFPVGSLLVDNNVWSQPGSRAARLTPVGTESVDVGTFADLAKVRLGDADGVVTLSMPSQLIADTDEDGELTAADFDSFTDKWESMGPDADFNHDGLVDAFDMAAFVDAFASGETRVVSRTIGFSRLTLQVSGSSAGHELQSGEVVFRTVLTAEPEK